MRRPIRPGDVAPEFTLATVLDGTAVSLAKYREKTAVLLGLFRGLHCPFCRRQIFHLSGIQSSLTAMGVTTLIVVNTQRERAALYFRYQPAAGVLLVDPEASVHRLFGVPEVIPDEAFMRARINPTGELPHPMHPMEANVALNAKDGFEISLVDTEIFDAHGRQLVGHFLIDRHGVVRWTSIEAEDGVDTVGIFPSVSQILAAARTLPERA